MISERAAEFLLERGKITPGQLEEAKRTQGFFGGELVSHLLKLGFVDETALGEALTEVSGVPYASGERLRVVPLEALASVPAALAEKHRVIPFRLEDRRLRVAMLNPRDRLAMNEIQTATGFIIEPWITSEYRLYQALERHYRVRIPGIRPISLAPPSVPRLARRASAPATPLRAEASPELEVGLDGLPLDADVSPGIHYLWGPPPATRAEEPAPTVTSSAPSVAQPRPAPPRAEARQAEPFEELERALAVAESREAIAFALLDFCAGRARRAALFAVAKDGLRGMEGRGPGLEAERIRKVAVTSLEGTILETALRGDFYFGPVTALPVNTGFFDQLGGNLPATSLFLPIRVRERVVALLYLDDEEKPMLRPDVPLLRRVTAKAGLAFEILILKKKLKEM